ncbi:50S ribosomal L31, chloroplastic-like [Micractinium conductrix]|uniref:50S ribosomal protein L31 n=1 Tax=Micractinium conductrix TaxID=554055 RepID=A0A2P6VMZ1_9CHLO|nr:50S ribosomal L31, chloroplastic-like [Micractinium conductrix]|eukprot:PSC75472.1 50S ribosomal L31, chloroplastic-like [Micractinium conductrix]
MLRRSAAAPAFSSRCTVRPAQRGPQVVAMAKKGLHPEWHQEAKVVCNGEEVLTTSGTQGSYTVDIWSGNHPYFQGNTSTVVTDEGRVNRFKRRFAGLDSLATVETVSGQRAAAAAAKEAAAAANN